MAKLRSRQGKKRRAASKSDWWTRTRLVLLGSAVFVVLLSGWLLWPFWQLSAQLDAVRTEQPSRVFARPFELVRGAPVRSEELLDELDHLGYSRVTGGPERPGQFQFAGSDLNVYLRKRVSPKGLLPAAKLQAVFSGGRVAKISWQGKETARAELEAPILATFLGSEREEKRPVDLEGVAQPLIRAVLAAEDATFFSHAGLSIRGIARAAWVNLKGGEFQQGGSTLTQQLVKNLFLTHERTVARKLREVVLAVLVDLRYDKPAILSAYLNEIYWGSHGSVNLIGVGAASWAYFGRRPSELGLCESALLAAIIRSPGRYSPAAAPDRALGRRDWVLNRMAGLEWISAEEREDALLEPLCYDPHSIPVRGAPYFVDFVRREASERFGLDQLEGGGTSLLSTLDRRQQQAAEDSVSWGVKALEEGWEKSRRGGGELQAALIAIEPRSGAIRAYLGGRNYGSSQFDRASQAKRQAGSAFKPIVYAAALEEGAVSPASFVEDAPITVAFANRRWSPNNSDGDFRGWVTVREALERSLNIPTVRVALDAGLPGIIEKARALGLATPMESVPALALGAFEVTPLDLATVYASLGAGGVRPPVHGLRAILDPTGEPIEGRALPEPERALSPEATFILTTMLQGVLQRGTGAGLRSQGLKDPLAGKTGTTNDRRDSWFAGYAPQLAALVWVGYDDNSPTQLSGARAALPIWGRFIAKVRPPGGYALPVQPPGIVSAVIDPSTGELATDSCPRVLTEYFAERDLPERVCSLHGHWRDWAVTSGPGRFPDVEEEDSKKKRPWRWLTKIFGRKKNREQPQASEAPEDP